MYQPLWKSWESVLMQPNRMHMCETYSVIQLGSRCQWVRLCTMWLLPSQWPNEYIFHIFSKALNRLDSVCCTWSGETFIILSVCKIFCHFPLVIHSKFSILKKVPGTFSVILYNCQWHDFSKEKLSRTILKQNSIWLYLISNKKTSLIRSCPT